METEVTTKHSQIKNLLDRQLQAGRLSHAYLFVGPKGVGKKSFVLEFAKKVIDNENLFSHPDFAFLDCQEDASAEAVRDFIGRMALKPFAAQKKFAFISGIENLNIQGANALLKTLEEPAENTVIALTANTGKILPTIISRCMVFNFNPPSLKLRGTSGLPQKLMNQLTTDSDSFLSVSEFAGKSLAARLLAISQFSDLEELALKQSVEDFIYESARQLASAPEKYTQLAAGLKAYEDLNTNKNKKLILQGLLSKI